MGKYIEKSLLDSFQLDLHNDWACKLDDLLHDNNLIVEYSNATLKKDRSFDLIARVLDKDNIIILIINEVSKDLDKRIYQELIGVLRDIKINEILK